MSNVTALLATMQARFDKSAASGMNEVFQYDIVDVGSWQITIKGDLCVISEDADADPSVTLSMTEEVLASVISGETDGMQAFMSGSITAKGDIMLATRLTSLFPMT